jgi:hypothetical protein
MGVSHQIGSKHLKLPVTDDFADFIISLLLLSDLDEPLGKIGTCLEHQRTRGTTKIRLKGNLLYEPDIRIKNTTIQTNVGKMK